MTSRAHTTMTLTEFEHLLDVHGADRTRWPLAARASAAALVDSDRTARRLLAEAEALDSVLAQAGTRAPDDPALSALADRIMLAAQRAPRLVANKAAPAMDGARRDAVGDQRRAVGRDSWRGIAVLAASLMIGIFVGQTQFAAGALPAIEALSGVTFGADKMAMLATDLDASEVD
jgi:hypothetical protein